jgi:hypothetical protein
MKTIVDGDSIKGCLILGPQNHYIAFELYLLAVLSSHSFVY